MFGSGGHGAGDDHGFRDGRRIRKGSIALPDLLPLLAADFAGEYQVHVAAAAEFVAMLRFALSLLAAPFVVTAALISARVLAPDQVDTWSAIPAPVFALLLAFGLLAFLPYLRMIEASVARVRTARALNNFRLLYAAALREHALPGGWTPNLPVDPHYPVSCAPLSWPGISAMMLAVLEAGETGVGVTGLASTGTGPVIALIASLVPVLTAILVGVYLLRTAGPPRHRPVNPLGFPDVET